MSVTVEYDSTPLSSIITSTPPDDITFAFEFALAREVDKSNYMTAEMALRHATSGENPDEISLALYLTTLAAILDILSTWNQAAEDGRAQPLPQAAGEFGLSVIDCFDKNKFPVDPETRLLFTAIAGKGHDA